MQMQECSEMQKSRNLTREMKHGTVFYFIWNFIKFQRYTENLLIFFFIPRYIFLLYNIWIYLFPKGGRSIREESKQ